MKDSASETTLKVAEGSNTEFIVTRHGQFKPALNIINIYGAQESRQTVEDIKTEWD